LRFPFGSFNSVVSRQDHAVSNERLSTEQSLGQKGSGYGLLDGTLSAFENLQNLTQGSHLGRKVAVTVCSTVLSQHLKTFRTSLRVAGLWASVPGLLDCNI
jgi:hypothetical protein